MTKLSFQRDTLFFSSQVKAELLDNNNRQRAACSSSFRIRRFLKDTPPCENDSDDGDGFIFL